MQKDAGKEDHPTDILSRHRWLEEGSYPPGNLGPRLFRTHPADAVPADSGGTLHN
jgi:hypothetical protein